MSNEWSVAKRPLHKILNLKAFQPFTIKTSITKTPIPQAFQRKYTEPKNAVIPANSQNKANQKGAKGLHLGCKITQNFNEWPNG